jgi:hypothetical protein
MIGVLYLSFCIVGTALASHYVRHSRRFFWKEYSTILIPILLGLLGLIFLVGIKILWVFLVSCIVVPFLEWCLGWVYRHITGSHLWIYERYALPGRYTSWLTIPIWGGAFVVLWLIMHQL